MTLTKDVIADIVNKINSGEEHRFNPDEYTRLPTIGPSGRISGLSRTTLLEIGERCPGLILTLRQKHAQRGIKLLHLPTLARYLESLREGQEVEA
jgi:hypothetical protein